MDADRNLLFGVLALQGGLIDAAQLAEACTAWAARGVTPLADLLVGRGWLTPEDRAHVEYFLSRRLARHGGDAHASLIAATAGAELTLKALASIGDPEVQHTLTHVLAPTPAAEARTAPDPAGHVLVETILRAPATRDRYTLTRLHARGGIGQVWLARDG